VAGIAHGGKLPKLLQGIGRPYRTAAGVGDVEPAALGRVSVDLATVPFCAVI